MMQWDPKARVDLWPEVKVTHQGEPRQQWFGRDVKNARKMRNLFQLGLWEAWFTRAGHVKVPDPQADRVLDVGNMTLEEIRWLLQKYTDPDPFRYRLRIESSYD